MQVSSALKCPWCFYKFDTDHTKAYVTGIIQAALCPRCENKFRFMEDEHKLIHNETDCSSNGLRHNWKYKFTEGYDLYKKCRRCGKEDFRPAQLELPGMQAKTT